MIEAAIQLDLITPEQAKTLVEKGKTLGEWPMEQEKGKAGKTRASSVKYESKGIPRESEI